MMLLQTKKGATGSTDFICKHCIGMVYTRRFPSIENYRAWMDCGVQCMDRTGDF